MICEEQHCCRSLSRHVPPCYFDVEFTDQAEVSRLIEPQDEPISDWELANKACTADLLSGITVKSGSLGGPGGQRPLASVHDQGGGTWDAEKGNP